MEIKGLSTLEWWLTKWLKDHGFKNLKARVAADFQYDNDEGTVYFALVTAEDSDKKFLKFIQNEFYFPYDCDNFILSFFHEIGHAETWEWWTDEEWDEYFEAKARINEQSLPIELYFSLNQEYYATEWGVRYILTHSDEIEGFWRVCQKLLFNIYKQNSVD